MKKFTLTLAAVMLTLSATAGNRILFRQTYEAATDPAALGWTCGGGTLSIGSDQFGQFLVYNLGNNNGRSAMLNWGEEIFLNEDGSTVLEDGTYTVELDYNVSAAPNNQCNSELAIYTNRAPIANQPYTSPWSPAGHWDNYIFALTQVNATKDDPFAVCCNCDTVGQQLMPTNTWYHILLNVNVADRTVDYSMSNLADPDDILFSGTREVPETDANGDPISMYVQGLEQMAARYWSEFQFDNLVIYFESAYDYAAAPAIALSRVGKTADDVENLNMRAYTISFLEGEELYVLGVDGKEETVAFDDCEGSYVYETTTSGTLSAWTVSGTAKSEVTTVEVDCTPIALPAATYAITTVSEGYGKTFALYVDNKEVPLTPTIFISYEFKGTNGESLSAEDLGSGATVAVSEAGTLNVTTAAFGYQPTTVTINNDLEFAVKQIVDFARLTPEQIAAWGLPAAEDLRSDATSGENNWTARKRLFYYNVNDSYVDEEGNTQYTQVFPFGYDADNDQIVIKRYNALIADEGTDPEGIYNSPVIAPVQMWNNGRNIGMLYRIGAYNNETKNNYNPVTVTGLAESDFVMFNTIGGYGSDSCHPLVATDEEYYAELGGTNTVTSPSVIDPSVEYSNKSAACAKTQAEDGTWNVIFPLYRIDTVLTKVTIFNQLGAGINDIIGDKAAEILDNGYYTIDGLRFEQPVKTGIYIHQGKKVYIIK